MQNDIGLSEIDLADNKPRGIEVALDAPINCNIIVTASFKHTNF